MRFLHLADLHIGKILHKQNLIEDQKYILQQILNIAKEQHVDAVLIAGDVYQRNAPSSEAMTVFSDFLSALAAMKLPCFLISGNHDSAERVAYLSELAAQSGIQIAPADSAAVYSFPLTDDFGSLTVHLLPFTTPLQVRQRYPEEAAEIHSYDDALRVLLSHYPVPAEGRHVLVAHQYLTGGATCDSEELAIGGLDNVSASLFDSYDYVALGHLHGPQFVSREAVRYAGSPLKYSFSECTQRKSVTVVELREKGNLSIETLPLRPLRDMHERTGKLSEILADAPSGDYMHVILTDETVPADAVRQLRIIYPNLLRMSVRNSSFREAYSVEAGSQPEQTDFLTLLQEFYAFQNQGAVLNEKQQQIVSELLSRLDGEAGAS